MGHVSSGGGDISVLGGEGFGGEGFFGIADGMGVGCGLTGENVCSSCAVLLVEGVAVSRIVGFSGSDCSSLEGCSVMGVVLNGGVVRRGIGGGGTGIVWTSLTSPSSPSSPSLPPPWIFLAITAFLCSMDGSSLSSTLISAKDRCLMMVAGLLLPVLLTLLASGF